MEEKKWRGKEERKREEIKEGRRERKERKQKGRRREAGSQRNFSPSSTHGIPTGWAYRCATGVRVKTFNNRLGPALTNGMETQQELGSPRGLRTVRNELFSGGASWESHCWELWRCLPEP